MTTSEAVQKRDFPAELLWLADSPLFIDSTQIEDLSVALFGNDYETESIVEESTAESRKTLSSKGAVEAKFSFSELASFLTFLKPEVGVKLEAGGEEAHTQKDANQIVLRPIRTAQRQLVKLTYHYFTLANDRIFFLSRPKIAEWCDPEAITAVPREILFIEFPSLQEAEKEGLPETKIIPTAAEFSNGSIVTFYDKLKNDSDCPPPKYPEWKKGVSAEELRHKRKEYWQWFDQGFNATRTMVLLENLASQEASKISWIDFRMMLTPDGDTLHLHISPRGGSDTGVFAYNFIKRAFTHGIRLVGTIRSEPSMNVLAIYDK